ncbi:hypothetical protein [Rhodoligotrophos ferricapiens]|uniref:hypothetical protein n=1 Tax=Rhodoligotrophos ferricapiens TaxID=3069264 RepID=UPI00315CCBB2
MNFSKLTWAAVLAAAIMSNAATPMPAQAHGHGGGAFVGGLIAGAVVGGAVAAASRPYPYYHMHPRAYYGPGCGYYPYPPCAPVYAPPPPPPPYYYPR